MEISLAWEENLSCGVLGTSRFLDFSKQDVLQLPKQEPLPWESKDTWVPTLALSLVTLGKSFPFQMDSPFPGAGG